MGNLLCFPMRVSSSSSAVSPTTSDMTESTAALDRGVDDVGNSSTEQHLLQLTQDPIQIAPSRIWGRRLVSLPDGRRALVPVSMHFDRTISCPPQRQHTMNPAMVPMTNTSLSFSESSFNTTTAHARAAPSMRQRQAEWQRQKQRDHGSFNPNIAEMTRRARIQALHIAAQFEHGTADDFVFMHGRTGYEMKSRQMLELAICQAFSARMNRTIEKKLLETGPAPEPVSQSTTLLSPSTPASSSAILPSAPVPSPLSIPISSRVHSEPFVLIGHHSCASAAPAGCDVGSSFTSRTALMSID